MINDIEAIKVPPQIQVVYEDWTSHYENDPHFQPHWSNLRVNKYVHLEGKSYTVHQSNVRTQGRLLVSSKQSIRLCISLTDHMFASA